MPNKAQGHYTLSRWVSWQRKRKGENQLSPRRVDLLNQIGFDWDVNRERDNRRRWERMYLRLKRFYRKHGHSKVPENYQADKKLAIWVGMQRQYEWRLNADRKQRLKDLHFVFQADLQRYRDGTWEEMFDKLASFQQTHGHCRVTINHPDGKLFRWVAKQRRLGKQGKLSPPRKERLDELGFTWIEDTQKRLTDRWHTHFAQLLAFQERYGHLQVPEGWAENPKLAQWVADQRRKEHLLPADRKQLLDAAGFRWSLDLRQQKERDWEEKYHQLAGFQQRFGHCRVPVDWSENASLGIWVFRQRKQYRLGKLPIHRQQQLDQLGFSWEVSKGPEAKRPINQQSPR